ncbi:MAG: hypothetical protein Q9202_004440 [Teloschistes flavicans]
MGRELQKKKNRSSIPKVKHKRKNKNTKKVQVKGNAVVAANWNRKETLSQNYRRLGLVSKLNSRAGGVEVTPSSSSSSSELKTAGTGLAIRNADPTTLVPGTVRIERDPDTGAIVRVIGDEEGAKGERHGVRRWGGRELRDLLGAGDEDGRVGQHDLPISQGVLLSGRRRDKGRGERGIVPDLLRQAEGGGVRKRPRKQSRMEEEWIEALVGRYGDDVGGMARDRKLNPMQQSEGDIGRRVKAWKKGRRKDTDDDIEMGV